MKVKFTGTLILITAFVTGCCFFCKDDSLDSFEGEISIQTMDYGSGGGADLTVSADATHKFHGKQSLKIDYDKSDGGYFWAGRGYGMDIEGAAQWNQTPEEIDWTQVRGISVAMFGTNSGGSVAFDVRDNGKEMWRFIIVDEFEGWQEVIIPWDKFQPRTDWQPHDAEKNGELNFPIHIFQFEPRSPKKGTFHFDCVRLVKLEKQT